MRPPKPLLTARPLVLIVLIAALLIAGREGRAIQAPRISIDMNPAGNTYDANTNTMVTGPIDQCLGSDPPGNNAAHIHIAHLIIQEVEDLVGWQARLHYDGGRMRLSAANFQPFPDDLRGQGVGFTDLPIEADVHRQVSGSTAIPAGAPGSQSALVGATYQGTRNPIVSADTPPKAPPDHTSYAAPTGGVLASLTLQVLPGQAGQPPMAMDLDDGSPTAPGSKVLIFSGVDANEVDLAETSLFDGFHAEGGPCVLPPGAQTPPPTTAPGGPGGPGGPGDGAGGSPGATSGAGGGSPGAGSPGASATGSPGGTGPAGSRTPTRTPDDDGSEDNEEEGGASDGEDGGMPIWPFILIGIVAIAAAGGAFAAWRYRARIPWLRDRFPG